MASRRLAISSLLNDAANPSAHSLNPSPPPPPPAAPAPAFSPHHPHLVPEPVVLAPHLRTNPSHRPHVDYPFPSSSHDSSSDRRASLPSSAHAAFSTPSSDSTPTTRRYLEQDAERARPAYPNHPPEQPPQSRPSSSRSSNSPHVPYRYPQPPLVSPILSPAHNSFPLPERRTPPVPPQRSSAPQHPIYPRHPRPSSQTRSADHPQVNPYPQPHPSQSSSSSNPNASQFNLLVHIATEERRKLSGGNQIADAMPNPSPTGHQFNPRQQFGGTSDQTPHASVKKTSEWLLHQTADCNDDVSAPQTLYPHRNRSMSIHDHLIQPQVPANRSSPHLVPPISDPLLSPAESSGRLPSYRLQAQNVDRQIQKMEETRQKTEEQRRRHQMRLEEQKLLNDQREQRQQQRLQQQREQERMIAEAVAVREREGLERERQLQDERFSERSLPITEASSPHPPSSTSAPPIGSSQGATATRRPLSMESLLHPQPNPLPHPPHRPLVPPIDTSTSAPPYPASTTRPPPFPTVPSLEAHHNRIPSRKSDPGLPTQAPSSPQRPNPISPPMSSLPPTLSNLVTPPTQQTVSPSLQALLSPSHTTIRLPPPLTDPRPPKKPRVSAEDLPSTSRLTAREEQTLNAIRNEQQRRAEEAAVRKAREEERYIQDMREKLRRERTREMQLEREREAQLDRGDRIQIPQDSSLPWDTSRADMGEPKAMVPIPISADPTNILEGIRGPQVIQLLPREESPTAAPPLLPRPPPPPPALVRERASPPRIVKLEAIEPLVDVRQSKRSPPGSQEGRAKAARRADNPSHVMQESADATMSTKQVSEVRTDSDFKANCDGVHPLGVSMTTEGNVGGGPGRAKQVAKEKGSRTHSLLRTSDSIPKRAPSPHSVTRLETEKLPPLLQPLSQPPPKESQPQRDRPPQADAHEWLLEHYSTKRSAVLHEVASPQSSPGALDVSPSEVTTTDTTLGSNPVITICEDAVAALEQELEDILMEEPETDTESTKFDNRLGQQSEVDKVVTELVAETLDGDALRIESDSRREESGPVSQMEVDVEDELLSLVDDRPQHAAPRASPPLFNQDAGKAKPSSTPKPNDQDSRQAPPPAGLVHAHLMAGATPERGSMPPPAPKLPIAKGKEKDQDKDEGHKGEHISSAPMKKKSGPKPKTAAVSTSSKPRAKPGPKTKGKNADVGTAGGNKVSKTLTSRKAAPTTARSRSTSAMPSGSVGPEADIAMDKDKEKENEPEENAADDDDKLYCVCKTKYDEDRVMIACDRCDDWYHTQCVNMPDLEVDLVDQFICPPCIEQNPHLSLRTTYKKRCSFGLSHADPSSPDVCHKPARGAFSKYCSDECGYRCMQARINDWTKRGGKKETLWESVKDAEKREGVVMRHDGGLSKADSQGMENKQTRIKPEKSKTAKEVERLKGLLERVVHQREDIKRGMEVVGWRERLLDLATDRALQLGQCGWDQRLCFGDEEWTEFGEGVLESYEEFANGSGAGDAGEGEWWCPGPSKCERHAGWQGVRHKDIMKEKENKEEALLKLTTRERELRKLIEDLVGQYRSAASEAPAKSPLAFSNNKLSNGHFNHNSKPKINGDAKKGKKRKAMT